MPLDSHQRRRSYVPRAAAPKDRRVAAKNTGQPPAIVKGVHIAHRRRHPRTTRTGDLSTTTRSAGTQMTRARLSFPCCQFEDPGAIVLVTDFSAERQSAEAQTLDSAREAAERDRAWVSRGEAGVRSCSL